MGLSRGLQVVSNTGAKMSSTSLWSLFLESLYVDWLD